MPGNKSHSPPLLSTTFIGLAFADLLRVRSIYIVYTIYSLPNGCSTRANGGLYRGDKPIKCM